MRRDASAATIFVFYVLSCAFRTRAKTPLFLPGAPLSRKLLFDTVADLELDHNYNQDRKSIENKLWHMVLETAFNRAFTKITEEVEKLIGFSRVHSLIPQGDHQD